MRIVLTTALLILSVIVPAVPPALASIPDAAPRVFQEQPAAGKFLIASETIGDPRFRESVILLLNHGADGTVGLIINRPTRIPLSDVIEGEIQGQLLFGGPVQPSVFSLLIRDREGRDSDDSRSYVLERIWFVFGTEDAFDQLARLEEGAEARVYAGYTGWGPGQLDAEIRNGGWHLLAANPAVVFAEDPSQVWGSLMRRASGRWI